MKTKKLIALGLTLAMAFTLAGCGSASSKIAKACDKQDFVKVDEKDFDPDDFEDDYEDDFESGVYITLKDSDNFEDLADSLDIDEDDIKSVFVAMKENKKGTLIVYSIEFSDKDTAEDYFDDQVDELEESADILDAETDDDDNYFKAAVEFDDAKMFMAVELDGSTVTMFTVSAESKKADVLEDMDAIFDAIGSESPSELL